jgi:plasmid maintenance system killer protein
MRRIAVLSTGFRKHPRDRVGAVTTEARAKNVRDFRRHGLTPRAPRWNIPPCNRLEVLRGNRKGRHSIRVDDQWRICFRWKDGDAHDVQIVDYH